MRQREGDQPLPVPNDEPYVADLLREFVEHRKQLGIQRYGTPLQPHNGRSFLRDLLDELVDASEYCIGKIIEEEGEFDPRS